MNNFTTTLLLVLCLLFASGSVEAVGGTIRGGLRGVGGSSSSSTTTTTNDKERDLQLNGATVTVNVCSGANCGQNRPRPPVVPPGNFGGGRFGSGSAKGKGKGKGKKGSGSNSGFNFGGGRASGSNDGTGGRPPSTAGVMCAPGQAAVLVDGKDWDCRNIRRVRNAAGTPQKNPDSP